MQLPLHATHPIDPPLNFHDIMSKCNICQSTPAGFIAASQYFNIHLSTPTSQDRSTAPFAFGKFLKRIHLFEEVIWSGESQQAVGHIQRLLLICHISWWFLFRCSCYEGWSRLHDLETMLKTYLAEKQYAPIYSIKKFTHIEFQWRTIEWGTILKMTELVLYPQETIMPLVRTFFLVLPLPFFSPFFPFWKELTQVDKAGRYKRHNWLDVSAWHTITAGTACTNQTMLTKPRHTGYAGKMSTQQNKIGLREYSTMCPMVICNTSLTWSRSKPSLGGIWSIKIKVKS